MARCSVESTGTTLPLPIALMYRLLHIKSLFQAKMIIMVSIDSYSTSKGEKTVV
jgi:hypothetical protein